MRILKKKNITNESVEDKKLVPPEVELEPVVDHTTANTLASKEANEKAAEEAIKASGIEKVADEVVKDIQDPKKDTPAPKTPSLKPYTESKQVANRKDLGALIRESIEAGRVYKVSRSQEEGYRYIFEDFEKEYPNCYFVCHSDEDANNENGYFDSEEEARAYAEAHPEICCIFKVCGNEEEKIWEKELEESNKKVNVGVIVSSGNGFNAYRGTGNSVSEALLDIFVKIFGESDKELEINNESNPEDIIQVLEESLADGGEGLAYVKDLSSGHIYFNSFDSLLDNSIDESKEKSKVCPDCGKEICECDKKLDEADKPAAESIEDCQKWVDYDMEHYGEVSENTKEIIKKAGFQVVKDDHGDWEVVAGKFESVNEAIIEPVSEPGDNIDPEVIPEVAANNNDVVSDENTATAVVELDPEAEIEIDSIETFEPSDEIGKKTMTTIKDAGDGAMFAFKDTLKDLYNLKIKVSDLQQLLSSSSDWLLDLLGFNSQPEEPQVYSDEIPEVPEEEIEIIDDSDDVAPVTDLSVVDINDFDDVEPVDYEEEDENFFVGD